MKEKKKKTNIWLVIKNKEKGYTFTKYFETEWEKDKYKRKIKFIPYWILIEDSSDVFGNEDIEYIYD